MGYLNENDPNTSYGLMPGEAQAVSYIGWGPDSTRHFFQEMSIAGTLSDVPYSYVGNNYSYASQNPPQGVSNLFFGAPQVQIATPFNFNIPDGAAAGIDYSQVAAGNKINVSNSGAPPTTFTVGVDDAALQIFVDGRISVLGGTPSNSWEKITGDTGDCEAFAPNKDLEISTASFGGTDAYLSATVTGDNDTSKVEIDFTRPLYEKFTADVGTATPPSKNSTLAINGTTGEIASVVTGSTITLALDSSVFGYKTVATDESGVMTAAKGDQGLKFTNVTSNSVVASTLLITHEAGNPDEVRFNMLPVGHAGFGAQLVKITSSDLNPDTGTNEVGSYRRYEVTAFTFSGNGDSNADITQSTGQILLDYSHAFPQDEIETSVLDGETVQLEHVIWPVGTILLAQRVAANGYVTGLMPILKATCPS